MECIKRAEYYEFARRYLVVSAICNAGVMLILRCLRNPISTNIMIATARPQPPPQTVSTLLT